MISYSSRSFDSRNTALSVPADLWPTGKKLIVFINIALEGWSDEAAPGVGPMGNPLPHGVFDYQASSWAEYGPKRGMTRLLKVLERYGLSATVMTSGIIAERYPELVATVARSGHEICAHGYAQDLIPAMLDENAERASITDSVRALTAAIEARPTGWISPRCTPGPNTSRLLTEEGFVWYADVFDDDLPYREVNKAGSILAIPFTMEVNDLPLYVRHGQGPDHFVSVLQCLVDDWFLNHDEFGCIDITVHAHVFGRPMGCVALEKALAIVSSHEWIWIPTHAQLVACYNRLPRSK